MNETDVKQDLRAASKGNRRGNGGNGGNDGGSSLESEIGMTSNELATGLRSLSVLLERTQMLSQLGVQFDGARDLYAVFGYKKTLKYADYLAKYARQDIAARIVDAPAAATWKEPPEVTGSGGFDAVFEELVKKKKLWNHFERVDKLAGLGRYAVLFIGYDDGGTAQPVRPKEGRKLLYLQPLGESSVAIKSFVTNTRDERFGLPDVYELTISDPNEQNQLAGSLIVEPSTTSQTQTIKVHHSRIVHVLENSLEDRIYGIPRLSKVFNLLDDLLKVAGGSSETFWLTANRGLHADIDPEMTLDKDDATNLADMIDDYQHQLRRVIRTRGVKVQSLGSDVPAPDGNFNMLLSLISGATGIPKRILMGSEAGQLASEQDRANWAERVEERRTSFAEPSILAPCIDNLQAAGVLPESEYEVTWPDAFKMSPLERAQEMAQKARAAINFSKQTKNPLLIVSIEEAREILGVEGPAPVQPEPEPSRTDVQPLGPGAGGSGSGSGSSGGGNPNDGTDGSSQNSTANT